ncbi:MAG: carboxypeptidase regulatory-like domain-containing protein [Gammaproteobacteria bacterium]
MNHQPLLSAVTVTAAVLLPALFSGAVAAATVSGTVTTGDAVPLASVMVTLRDERGLAESVFTDAAGHFRLDTALAGKLALRVRKRYYDDVLQDLTLAADDVRDLALELAPLTDPKALSDAAPSLSHFSRIAFDADETAPFSRGNFARDCLSCHSLGNSFTRWPRPAASWVPTVQRMHGYFGNADMAFVERRAELLAAAFDGTPLDHYPAQPDEPALAGTRIYQFPLPGTVVPHDAEFDHVNGHIYSSEMFAGEILETNLETGTTRHFKLPADGLPPGGAFTQNGLPVPYGLTTPRAPHSLAQGPDGRWYLTDSIGAALTVFDPKTEAFESHPLGAGALYPHTVRVAPGGVVWFTIAFTDQVGRFDPQTKDMKVITLPKTASLSAPAGAVPYGIDVNPKDGSVWYAKLASDKIGRIDPETLAVTEIDSPVRAPRRQRFDRAGYLWIAGFSDGSIARFDPASGDATIYKLPVIAPGEIPAPYALAIDPVNQDVWVNDTMLDVAWRFIPAEERFITYPMPLRGTYTRDFTFTDKGWVCTSNNPIPAAALEGGMPESICIDTGDRASTALAGK